MCCVCVYVYYLMDNLDFKLSSFVLKFIFLLSNYLVYYIHTFIFEKTFFEKSFLKTLRFLSASILLHVVRRYFYLITAKLPYIK